MAKSKKSDSEKSEKVKILKALKSEKPLKEKKIDKKEKIAALKTPKKKAVALKSESKIPAKPRKPVEAAFTTEEISLRAYFIAERRQAMGWPGDSTSDWVEAERQLKTEAARAAKL